MEDLLLEKLKNLILTNYPPCAEGELPKLMYNTSQIHVLITKLYPEVPLTPQELANWLLANNYQIVDLGDMNFKWCFNTLD